MTDAPVGHDSVVLQVVTPARVFAVELDARRAFRVGSALGADCVINHAQVAPVHLVLRVLPTGQVEVESEGHGLSAQLNGIQLKPRAVASVGDEISLADASIIVCPLREAPAPPPRRPLSRAAFEARLLEELEHGRLRGAARSLRFADSAPPFVDPLPGALWGEWGPNLFACLSADEPTAAPPRDGDDVHAWVHAALALFVGAEEEVREPVVADSALVRLQAWSERMPAAPLLVEGAIGAGKRTWARRLQTAAGRAPLEVSCRGRAAPAVEEELFGALKRSGVCVLVSGVDALSEPLQQKLARALESHGSARVLATARRPPAAHLPGPWNRIYLPDLWSRPSDVLPLAEHFLTQLAARSRGVGRTLAAKTREVLLRHGWPGNVRELKNAIELAALCAGAPEIQPEDLPPSVLQTALASPAGEDLRAQLKQTERIMLEHTLAATKWNVTEAAKRLGLPRRTVVYRMARLGMKRPPRGMGERRMRRPPS